MEICSRLTFWPFDLWTLKRKTLVYWVDLRPLTVLHRMLQLCHVTTALPLNSRQVPFRSGWASWWSSTTGTQPACWCREGFCSSHSSAFEVEGTGGKWGGGRALCVVAGGACEPSRGFVLLTKAGRGAAAKNNINIFTDYSQKPQCTCNFLPFPARPSPLPHHHRCRRRCCCCQIVATWSSALRLRPSAADSWLMLPADSLLRHQRGSKWWPAIRQRR